MTGHSNLTEKVFKCESKLGNAIFKEKIDLVVLTKLIKSNLLQDYPADWIMMHQLGYTNEEKHLVQMRASAGKNGLLNVKYNRGKHNIGRFYPFRSLSLGSLRREIRHTLAMDEYVDIDIVNAHPVILVQLCEANGIKCDELKKYISHRDEYLQMVADEYGVSERDKQKNLFIRLLYFGSFEAWARDNGVIDPVATAEIATLTAEIQRIGKWLVERHTHLKKTLCSTVDKDGNDIEDKGLTDEQKKERKNKGRITSFILQEHERRILECVYDYLTLQQAIPDDNAVLCFDGIMILKRFYRDEFLVEMKQYVLEKTGFDVDFVQKEMNEGFRHLLEDQQPVEQEFEFEPEQVVRFDGKFCNSLGTYEEKKAYVEKFICKILLPTGLYVWTENVEKIDDFNNFTNKHLQINFKNECELTKDLKHIGSGQFTKQGIETRFTEVWFKDTNIRVYNRTDFIPRNSVFSNDDHHLKTVFNMFLGYNPEIQTPYDVEKRMKIVQPYLDVVVELCEGRKDCADYYLKFLAHKIKYPHKKLPYSFILKGKQGTGKTLHFNAIANIIRKEHFISSSEPNDFFGTHAEGLAKKLIVNMNECEGKKTLDFEGKMKSAISEDKLTLNAKHEKPIEIMNYAAIIITTNKETPITLDVRSGDRRYIVFKSTDKYLEPKYHAGNFWKKLSDHINKPEFIAALYDYLMSLEVDKMDWANERKKVLTEAYYDMAKQFVPATALFMEHLIVSKDFINRDESEFNSAEEYKQFFEKPVSEMKEYNEQQRIVGSLLHDAYKKWCEKCGFKKECEPTIKKFYALLKSEEIGITTETGHAGFTSVVFTPREVYEALIEKKYIIVDGSEKPAETVVVDENMFDEMFDF